MTHSPIWPGDSVNPYQCRVCTQAWETYRAFTLDNRPEHEDSTLPSWADFEQKATAAHTAYRAVVDAHPDHPAGA